MSEYSIEVEELTEASPRAQQPAAAALQLKPHQLALLQRCRRYETGPIPLLEFESMRRVAAFHGFGDDCCMSTQVGIVADCTGAGKSHVVLALAADRGPVRDEPAVRSYGGNRVLLRLQNQRPVVGATVLVVPHNLCSQWRGYVQAFGGGLTTLFVQRAADVTALRQQPNDAVLAGVDLVVVTSTFYSQLAGIISGAGRRVKRLVMDEVDNLNIPNSAPLEALFTWFVTASYGNLLYPRGTTFWDSARHQYITRAAGLRHKGFVSVLFSELSRNMAHEFVKLLVVRNSDAFVQQSMTVPPLEERIVRCRTPTAISVLNGLAANEVIERLNAGDVRSAVALLAPANRLASEDDVVAAVIESYAKQVRNLDLRIEYTQRCEYEAEEEREEDLQRLRGKRDEAEGRIGAIRERVRCCAMCLICHEEQIAQKTVVRCCQNAFCLGCISKWLATHPSCPMCKAGIGMRDLLVVDEGGSSAGGACAQDEGGSGSSSGAAGTSAPSQESDKPENLGRIMHGLPPDARVLIFSGYDQSFMPLTSMLDRLGMRHGLLKGNGAQIEATLRRFHAGELRVLLVNPRNYGSGLNMQCTTDIVMFHKFDDEISRQVIGRAQRFGRSAPLRVWHMLYENELPAP